VEEFKKNINKGKVQYNIVFKREYIKLKKKYRGEYIVRIK